MTHNNQLYALYACLTYAILYITIVLLTTRYNRAHQYRHEDDIELQCRNTVKDSSYEHTAIFIAILPLVVAMFVQPSALQHRTAYDPYR